MINILEKKNTHPPHTCGGHGGHGQLLVPILVSNVLSSIVRSLLVIVVASSPILLLVASYCLGYSSSSIVSTCCILDLVIFDSL